MIDNFFNENNLEINQKDSNGNRIEIDTHNLDLRNSTDSSDSSNTPNSARSIDEPTTGPSDAEDINNERLSINFTMPGQISHIRESENNNIELIEAEPSLSMVEIKTQDYFTQANKYSLNQDDAASLLGVLRDTAGSMQFDFADVSPEHRESYNRIFKDLLYVLSKISESNAKNGYFNQIRNPELLEINKYINYLSYCILNNKTAFIESLTPGLDALKKQVEQESAKLKDITRLFQAELDKNETIQLVDIAAGLKNWSQQLITPGSDASLSNFSEVNDNNQKYLFIHTAALIQHEPNGNIILNQPDETPFTITIAKEAKSSIPTMCVNHSATFIYKEMDYANGSEKGELVEPDVLSVNFNIDLLNRKRETTFSGSQAAFVHKLDIDTFDPVTDEFSVFIETIAPRSVLVQKMLSLLKAQLTEEMNFALKPLTAHTSGAEAKNQEFKASIEASKENIETILRITKSSFKSFVDETYDAVKSGSTLQNALQKVVPQIESFVNHKCGIELTEKLMNTVKKLQKSKTINAHQHFWRNVPRYVVKIIPAIFYTVMDQFVNPAKALVSKKINPDNPFTNPNHKGLIKGTFKDLMRNYDRITASKSTDTVIEAKQHIAKIKQIIPAEAGKNTTKGNPGKSYGCLFSATIQELVRNPKIAEEAIVQKFIKQTVALF